MLTLALSPARLGVVRFQLFEIVGLKALLTLALSQKLGACALGNPSTSSSAGASASDMDAPNES